MSVAALSTIIVAVSLAIMLSFVLQKEEETDGLPSTTTEVNGSAADDVYILPTPAPSAAPTPAPTELFTLWPTPVDTYTQNYPPPPDIIG